MSLLEKYEQIPDAVKVSVSVSSPTLSLFGVPVEQWTFVLSGIVSLLFIVEKLPTLIQRIKTFIKWIKSLKRN